jgi:hypothetical protein
MLSCYPEDIQGHMAVSLLTLSPSRRTGILIHEKSHGTVFSNANKCMRRMYFVYISLPLVIFTRWCYLKGRRSMIGCEDAGQAGSRGCAPKKQNEWSCTEYISSISKSHADSHRFGGGSLLATINLKT